jgi:hypothetical protein
MGCVAGLLLAGASLAHAQSTADAYFHEAARQYVADNVPAARRAVERGLAIAPADPRLLALKKKLQRGQRPEGRRDPDDGRSSGSKSGSQQNENASSNPSSKGGQTPSSEQSGAARTGAQDAASSRAGGARSGDRQAPRRAEQRGADARSSPGGSPTDRPAPADTTRRGRGGEKAAPLSRAQAERILRALEGQERRLLRQLRPRSSSREAVEKDW